MASRCSRLVHPLPRSRLTHALAHRFPTTTHYPPQQPSPWDTARARADSILKSRKHSDERASHPRDSVLFLSLLSFLRASLLVSLEMIRKRMRTVWMVPVEEVEDPLPFGSR